MFCLWKYSRACGQESWCVNGEHAPWQLQALGAICALTAKVHSPTTAVPERWVSTSLKSMSNRVHGQLTHALLYGKHATDAKESVSSC